MRPLIALIPLLAFLTVACSDKSEGAPAAAAAAVTSPTASVSSAGEARVTPGTGGGPTGSATGPAEHDGQRALAHVVELSKEPRVSGTPAEARAATYIAGQFRSSGYTVEVMEFEFDGDRFRAGEVTFDGKTIEALTLAGSRGGAVSAPAVFVGLADEAGIAGQDLTGKMAVAERGVLNFGVKYENVKAAGAVGLVVVNNRPGSFSGNLATGASIPVVGVSQEDGAAVIDAARAGREVGLEAPPTVGLTKALNVIAKPSTDSQCAVLLGGHFDSVPSAPGANDNASGTANVIELARALAVDGLDEGICFATFGAEESGLYGSKALVERLRSEDALPRYMVNLDVTGIGTRVEVIGDGPLVQTALALAAGAGIPAVPSRLPANSGSDHESFLNAGIETVFFTSGDFSTIHSPADVMADIDVEMLDQIGDVVLLVVKDLLAEVAQG
ncbi:MAG: M20/M25/M40 family metallo-hydrolase [Dehalococcoidia bacterium]|nr:M20/M25/M40 family metallo-hydrolase [Dehalococcoidia bacterium]